MLIPYNTDAPIYHFPFATIGVIAANALIFVTIGGYAADGVAPPGVLKYDTINPIQWITSVFQHAGIMHLLGNMFFLWVFGLVVEGKIGWWKFLSVYFAIAVVIGAFEQVLMFLLTDGSGGSLGASGVIFGLMAIAVMWAPKNDVSCVLLIFFRPFFFEMSLLTLSGLYVGMQIVFLFLQGPGMSSEWLHLIGFFAGLPVGLLLLRNDWVECEGWDFVTLYVTKGEQRNKTRDRHRASKELEQRDVARAKQSAEWKRLNQTIQDALQSGQIVAAVAIYKKHRITLSDGARLNNKSLIGLAQAMQKAKEWELAVPLLVEWIRRLKPDRSIPLRLNLARILVQASERPKQALAVLKKLPEGLNEEQRRLSLAISKRAKQAARESLEVEVHDW